MTAPHVPTEPVNRLRPQTAAMAIAIAGGLAYANSFSGTFAFDDFPALVENASIRNLTDLGAVLRPPIEAGVGGRPLANFTYALNYAISGRETWSYHLFNLLCHVAAGLALFGVLRRTLLAPAMRERWAAVATPLAGAAALLWTVHPLQTAVVDYLSQRTEGLMALWYLTTLWCFVRAAETGARKWQLGAVAACALGMASKETMATAPVAVLLYDRTFLAGSFRAAWAARGKIHLALAATWLLLAALMLGSQVGARGVGFGLGVPWMDYALTQAYSILHYLRLAVLPAPLVFDYGWTFLSPGQALPYVAGCALLAGGILAAMRRRPAAGFAGAWFLLLLAPTSSVIPIVQQPTAESRAYLPLAGLVALAVLGGHRLCRNRLGATLAVAAALAVACGVATHRRNLDYRDEVVLWSDTVAKRPDSARAHGNLSSALLRAGRTGEARAAAATAVRLRPDYPEAHNNLGIVLAQAGDFDAAIEHYRAALRGHPEHAEAQHNLGDALARSGRPAEAISSFEAALRLKPGRVETHNNLGVILLQLGRVEEALVHDRAAIALDPGFADAHYNLGNALAQKGRNEEAAQHFRQALALDPTFAKAANNLGVLHLRAGRFAEASAQFEAALRIKPDYADARRNLERMRPQIIPAP